MQKILRELSNVIGLADTIELTRRWGGRSLSVPLKVEASDPLALTLGLDTARKLVAEYRGECLDLPAERNALLDLRNESIVRDHDGGKGVSLAQLGLRYGLSRQGVSAVLAKMARTQPAPQLFALSRPVAAQAESAPAL